MSELDAARMSAIQKVLEPIEDLLQSAFDAMDTYVDVDDGEDGQPVANRAMRAQQDLEDAMRRLERALVLTGKVDA